MASVKHLFKLDSYIVWINSVNKFCRFRSMVANEIYKTIFSLKIYQHITNKSNYEHYPKFSAYQWKNLDGK